MKYVRCRVVNVVRCCALLLIVAAPAFAAVRVEFRGTVQSFKGDQLKFEDDTNEILFVGDGKVISDAGRIGVIFDAYAKSVTFIDNAEKTYSVAKLPLLLEDYASEEQREIMAKLEAFFSANRVEIVQSSEPETKGRWEANRVYADVASADNSLRLEMEVWFSDVFGGDDLSIYDEYARCRFALSMFMRPWAERLISIKGFVVSQRTTFYSGQLHKLVEVKELVAVDKGVELSADMTLPPTDYRQIPFDITEHVGLPRKR